MISISPLVKVKPQVKLSALKIVNKLKINFVCNSADSKKNEMKNNKTLIRCKAIIWSTNNIKLIKIH
jgi:hypothetical protein